MSRFEYQEIDEEGRKTLDAISTATRFNKWMYETVAPYCEGKILEIGSGIGNVSTFFINDGADITLSDIRPVYCNILKEKFPKVRNVVTLNLMHPSFRDTYLQHLEKYDTVFALNVVEHIEDDALAIRNCNSLIKKGGKLIILVPAYEKLFNRFDKELDHYRRYTRIRLNNLIEGQRFQIIHSQYFNFIGMAGWYISGKIQENNTIPIRQISLFDKWVPLFKIIDRIILHKAGLSVITIGIKR